MALRLTAGLIVLLAAAMLFAFKFGLDLSR